MVEKGSYNNAVYSHSLGTMPGLDPLSLFGNFGANVDVVPAPLPAAGWLLGSGLLGLMGIRRNRK
ncbi:MAG: VPLPA-CTERM sorting domain-containing protein [Geobacteraceae bacterium]|nr:VPLPA-CTERM sorting domain-containing protein [Geobacteraceae bacterium]